MLRSCHGNDLLVKSKEVFIFEALWSFKDTVIMAVCIFGFPLISFFTCALGYGVHVLEQAKHILVNRKWQNQQVVCSLCYFFFFFTSAKYDWGHIVPLVYLTANISFCTFRVSDTRIQADKSNHFSWLESSAEWHFDDCRRLWFMWHKCSIIAEGDPTEIHWPVLLLNCDPPTNLIFCW